ncbi:MAG: hypothetical protein EPO41_23315 [Reyranella sp.]|uniref:hypothetical protein n=1 Tax=Reyranella sp. TaxID=1929291 RepID=UPI0011F844D8|nr:hypothetical protein [Reyranella sp.]TAJ87273.1 MAG: hypothetical protein EPO41_23315 [Reyranella sp.]
MEKLTLLNGEDRWFFPNRVTLVALKGKGSTVGGIGRAIIGVAEPFDEVTARLDDPDQFARFEKEPKVPVWVRVSAVSWVSPPTPARDDGIRAQIGVGGDAIGVTASVEDVVTELERIQRAGGAVV